SSGATITSGTINILDTYLPTAGLLTTNSNLVLKSDTTTTARVAPGSTLGNYITGSLIVERYVPGKRVYRFISHPFTHPVGLNVLLDEIDITGSGGASNGFVATGTNAPSAYWFDVTTADTVTSGANSGWKPFTSTLGGGVNSWD